MADKKTKISNKFLFKKIINTNAKKIELLVDEIKEKITPNNIDFLFERIWMIKEDLSSEKVFNFYYIFLTKNKFKQEEKESFLFAIIDHYLSLIEKYNILSLLHNTGGPSSKTMTDKIIAKYDKNNKIIQPIIFEFIFNNQINEEMIEQIKNFDFKGKNNQLSKYNTYSIKNNKHFINFFIEMETFLDKKKIEESLTKNNIKNLQKI